MTQKKRLGLLLLLAAAIVAGVALVSMQLRSVAPASPPPGEGKGPAASTGSAPHPASARAKPVLRSAVREEDEEDDGRTPAQRALAERIEKALDDENLAAAIACAGDALKCEVAEIRQDMVDALGWFGEKALPELTSFLADPDEDVRQSAIDEWTNALSAIEDDRARIGTVELAMSVLKDEDALEDISGEYLGVDEKLAVESLVRIITGEGAREGAAKARETYEFVTGEEWAGVEAAERWLAEEYEPPQEES